MTTIAQLLLGLKRLPDVDPRWSTSDSAASLAQLNNALAGYSTLTVDEFCERLKLAPPKKAPKKKSTSSSVAVETVKRYVEALVANQDIPDRFGEVLQNLKADKSVRVPEAKAIAEAFTGSASKTKAEAIKSIQKRQTAIARGQHRRLHIQDLF